MSDNFGSSPYQPTRLNILQETKLTPAETAVLVENAIARVKSITSSIFHENADHSYKLSEIIVEAIARNKKLILTYDEWDKNQRKMPRKVIPLALYHATRIPGEPILSDWKHGVPQGSPTYKTHSHLKMSVFQTEGHSRTMQRGFKELNLADITNLWLSPTDPEEDDLQKAKEKFVLKNINGVEYIIQLDQTSLKEYRDQLLAILAKK